MASHAAAVGWMTPDVIEIKLEVGSALTCAPAEATKGVIDNE